MPLHDRGRVAPRTPRASASVSGVVARARVVDRDVDPDAVQARRAGRRSRAPVASAGSARSPGLPERSSTRTASKPGELAAGPSRPRESAAIGLLARRPRRRRSTTRRARPRAPAAGSTSAAARQERCRTEPRFTPVAKASLIGGQTTRGAAEGAAGEARASTSSATSGATCSTSARRSRCGRACARTSRRAAATAAPRSAARARDRRPRGDRHRQRGRGAAPRAEPRQAPPAAVQRAAARRQVVPVHRRHGRGRVPARHVHARAAPPRRPLLRPVREREEGARDARRAQPRLPVPAVRGPEAGPALRDPVPRLPHRALPRALRRLHLEGGLPRDHRRRDQLPLRRHADDRARARAADARGGRRRALRGRGALPQPAVRDPAPGRAAGGRPARDRHDRRDRHRGRRRPGGRAGLPAPRRQDDRPLRLPPRERRGPGR